MLDAAEISSSQAIRHPQNGRQKRLHVSYSLLPTPVHPTCYRQDKLLLVVYEHLYVRSQILRIIILNMLMSTERLMNRASPTTTCE